MASCSQKIPTDLLGVWFLIFSPTYVFRSGVNTSVIFDSLLTFLKTIMMMSMVMTLNGQVTGGLIECFELVIPLGEENDPLASNQVFKLISMLVHLYICICTWALLLYLWLLWTWSKVLILILFLFQFTFSEMGCR